MSSASSSSSPPPSSSGREKKNKLEKDGCVCFSFIPFCILGTTVAYLALVLGLHYLRSHDLDQDCLSSSNFYYADPEGDEDRFVDGQQQQQQQQQQDEEDVLGSGLESDPTLCQSEFVDNTILNWSSQFFVAIVAIMAALNLSWCSEQTSYKSTLLFMIFMMGTFTLRGVATLMFPNSGVDDNLGLLGYWIVGVMTSSIFYVVAILCLAHYALDLYDVCYESHPSLVNRRRSSSPTTPSEDRQKGLCSRICCCCCRCFCHMTLKTAIGFGQIFLLLSLSGVLLGGIWCSLTADVQTTEVYDSAVAIEESSEGDKIHMCFTIFHASETILNVCWSLLWIPIGKMFWVTSTHLVRIRATKEKAIEEKHLQQGETDDDTENNSHRGNGTHASTDNTSTVSYSLDTTKWGLSASWSAVLSTFLQWTGGSMFVVYLTIISEFILKDKTFLDVWNDSYGAVVYHWSMMVTLICIHCLASCLTIQNVKVLKDELQRQRERRLEGQNVSWWTWVTSGAMLTWWWAEKNDNESVDNLQPQQQKDDHGNSSDDDDDIYTDDVDGSKSNNSPASVSSGNGTSISGAGTSKGSYFSAGGYSEIGC